MPRKPRRADDYRDAITAASRSGLAEIMTVLGAYRDALVLIGGWAPHLILEQFGYTGFVLGTGGLGADRLGGFVHVGSIDIDLVVDPVVIDAEQYATIVELLLDRGYETTAVPEILGRPVLPPNDMVRQFDAAYGTADQQLDLVVFLDGEERAEMRLSAGLTRFARAGGDRSGIFSRSRD